MPEQNKYINSETKTILLRFFVVVFFIGVSSTFLTNAANKLATLESYTCENLL